MILRHEYNSHEGYKITPHENHHRRIKQKHFDHRMSILSDFITDIEKMRIDHVNSRIQRKHTLAAAE